MGKKTKVLIFNLATNYLFIVTAFEKHIDKNIFLVSTPEFYSTVLSSPKQPATNVTDWLNGGLQILIVTCNYLIG